MKTKLLLIAMALAITGSAFANTQPIPRHIMDKAVQNYKVCLESRNEGVRTSALYQLAKIKSAYPQLDLTALEKNVSNLAKNDKSPLVRVNASITKAILTNELPTGQIETSNNDPDEYFGDYYKNIIENK